MKTNELSNWVQKFKDAGDKKGPALVEALVEKSKIARLQVIVAMKDAKLNGSTL